MHLAGEIDLELRVGPNNTVHRGQGGKGLTELAAERLRDFLALRFVGWRDSIEKVKVDGRNWCAVQRGAGDFDQAWRGMSNTKKSKPVVKRSGDVAGALFTFDGILDAAEAAVGEWMDFRLG